MLPRYFDNNLLLTFHKKYIYYIGGRLHITLYNLIHKNMKWLYCKNTLYTFTKKASKGA